MSEKKTEKTHETGKKVKETKQYVKNAKIGKCFLAISDDDGGFTDIGEVFFTKSSPIMKSKSKFYNKTTGKFDLPEGGGTEANLILVVDQVQCSKVFGVDAVVENVFPEEGTLANKTNIRGLAKLDKDAPFNAVEVVEYCKGDEDEDD